MTGCSTGVPQQLHPAVLKWLTRPDCRSGAPPGFRGSTPFCGTRDVTTPDRYTPEQRRAYMNRWRAARRVEAIQRLGGGCAICGSTYGLQFDHVDRTTKVATIAKMWTASREKFEAELLKCQLLCKKHHIEKGRAAGDILPASPHGSQGRYERYRCRCDICRLAHNARHRKYKHSARLRSSAGQST